MNIKETLISITRELEQCLQQIDTEQMADVTVALQKANRIFVYGTGRSLLMIRAFAHASYASWSHCLCGRGN